MDTARRRSFGDWFDGLDIQAASKVRRSVARMDFGNFGDPKPVGKGVIERRIDLGPGYRINFGRDGDDLVILITGGTKKRQQMDIETAQGFWADYKTGKKG